MKAISQMTFDFNSIPSTKTKHILQKILLHGLKEEQINYFSKCNITFLLYTYLLLYCRSFTKILVLLSSVKSVNAIFIVNVFNQMLFN